MSAPRVMRYASRATARWTVRGRQNAQWKAYSRRPCIIQIAAIEGPRYFSTSIRNYAGLMPDSEDPQPPNRVEEHRMTQPTEIDEEEYHTHADQYMDAIHEKAEEMQEEREDVEVEYSAGVLSVTLPNAGTYIINKQPPNKQIWLSSPTSGPKRYDWVLEGEAMHQKEGGGEGAWVYLRDGSNLADLLRKELGITIDLHHHDDDMKKSVDPTE